MKEEIFFLVIGSGRKIGIFESLEIAIDYGRSLLKFEVHRGTINDFRGAELIVRGSHSGRIEWLGRPDFAAELDTFNKAVSTVEIRADREINISHEEHLDWEV